MLTRPRQGLLAYAALAPLPLLPAFLAQCPIDQLPVKSEPTVAVPRGRSHLEHVAWATPEVLPVAQTRTVIDI